MSDVLDAVKVAGDLAWRLRLREKSCRPNGTGTVAYSNDDGDLDKEAADALEALLTAAEQSTEPVARAEEWRCFHCDERFTDPASAAEHFGKFEDCVPACKIGAERFRQMEAELAMWRSESDPATREFYALGAKHAEELRREEERGYERGLRDGNALNGAPDA